MDIDIFNLQIASETHWYKPDLSIEKLLIWDVMSIFRMLQNRSGMT